MRTLPEVYTDVTGVQWISLYCDQCGRFVAYVTIDSNCISKCFTCKALDECDGRWMLQV